MKYYRRVDIGSGEPVNFVGVHPLAWNDRRQPHPEAGFVEAENVVIADEKMIKQHPNDADLGAMIRQIYNQQK